MHLIHALDRDSQLPTEHRCEKPGCGRALVLDGNMKNHSCATYAGFAEFIGLPGRVRTGCPNTPAYKSPYCSLHKPVLTVPLRIQLPEDDADCEVNIPEPDKDSAKEPAGIIVEKRATRKSTFYKVNYMHHKRYYFTITIGISMLKVESTFNLKRPCNLTY